MSGTHHADGSPGNDVPAEQNAAPTASRPAPPSESPTDAADCERAAPSSQAADSTASPVETQCPNGGHDTSQADTIQPNDCPADQTHPPVILATLPDRPPTPTAVSPEDPPSGWRKNWLLWGPLTLVAAIALLAVPAVSLSGGFHRVRGLWLVTQAELRYRADDLEAANQLLDRAVEWLPDDPLVYDHRGQVRLERNDLEGALADFNRVIELNPHYYGGYAGRSVVYQRMGRFREAIDDCTQVLKLRPEWNPSPWNNRAYARALGNMELEAALADAERAIELSDEEVPAYLDTRGYIRYRLGQHEAALSDLNRAVDLAQRQYDRLQNETSQTGLSEDEQARLQRLAREELAVILHHRGLVHRALGHQAQATEDLQRAEQLGYDPQRGVY